MFASHRSRGVVGVLVGLACMAASVAWAEGYRGPFGFGSALSDAEIKAIDILVGPEGEGLPAGKGTAVAGEAVYRAKCAECHGAGGTEGPYDRLVGGPKPVKTIGSYWPYATTIFDYLRRAMPFNTPGSMTDEEVYAVTAWLLWKNNIIGANDVIDAATLPKIRMPNRDGFFPDRRPDTR
jgi:cytochrome c